ncbi:hypothetical protein PUN28_017330 [Cardiocondyla obscurior]|uniref:Uncharacterized protein n=1 Tax=Cardiocondyla obscurior TaxID=286306 RepID=A0AAW2ELA4_9HYME
MSENRCVAFKFARKIRRACRSGISRGKPVRVSGVLLKRWLQVAYSYTRPIHRSVKFNQTRNTALFTSRSVLVPSFPLLPT